jgi:hypothetical protein
LELNNNIIWQRCNRCDKYYPYHYSFFEKESNPSNKADMKSICKQCKQWTDTRCRTDIIHINKEYDRIYKKYGKEIYELYKSEDVIGIWKWWTASEENKLPNVLRNKESALDVLKYLHSKKLLKNKLTDKCNIKNIIKYDIFKYGVTIKDVVERLLGIQIKIKDGNGVDNFEDAKNIFLKYLPDGCDVYSIDIWKTISDSGLNTYLKQYKNDYIRFLMDIFNNQLLPYKFKKVRVFWTIKENRGIALKKLIEEDMQLEIEKIPLYLTKEIMRKKSNTMRDVLRKYYHNELFPWIDEVYPGRFNESDFNIGVIRNKFDSAEEHLIHDYLKRKFKNVLYNQRDTDNTIKIMGMIPDWFIITEKSVWIVEYFGMDNKSKSYNKRSEDYKNKTNSKIDRYKSITCAGKIYVFPQDIKGNLEGLEEKLKVIE